MIGIIGAMELETKEICALLENRKDSTKAGMPFVTGLLDGTPVVVSTCGPGKVFASCCAQIMILEYHPDYVINIGVGGTLSPSLHVCDLAVATGTVQHDMDTSPLGDPKGQVSKINKLLFECSDKLLSAARAALDETGIKAVFGVIATGDQFIDSHAKKEELSKDFNAICCEMEGGAIGQTCYINDTEYLVLRAISDEADGSAPISFESFAVKAAAQTVLLLRALLPHI